MIAPILMANNTALLATTIAAGNVRHHPNNQDNSSTYKQPEEYKPKHERIEKEYKPKHGKDEGPLSI